MSKHGIYIYESATPIAAPIESSSAVQVVIGTAPVNMVEDPSAVVNKPILANSAQEAIEALGYCDDFENYTLCQSIYAMSNVYQVFPVVFINVLDPATHKTAVTETTCSVTDKQAVLNVFGMIKSSVVVKDGSDTITLGTDYTLEFDSNGYLVVTLISGSTHASATTLKISGNKLDPSAITASDIVGAYNVNTGAETGMEVIRQVYPKLGVVPGLLLAPGWSQVPTVGIALMAKAANINGCFKAMALLDLDTATATKYTDCLTVKNNSSYTSEFCQVLWPSVKIGEYIFAASAIVGALIAYTDANNEDVPSLSPSNKRLAITGTCLASGAEISLDQDQANTVNGYGVTTMINMNGWRLWGNYTGAYPSSTDAKDIWFPVRRMFNWHGNNFLLTYFSKVDDPMNYILIESIVDSENIRSGAYAPDKWAGASIEYLESDNPITDILAGKMTFRQHIAPYTPAQEIDNILSYDISMLQSALLGGE
jgi:phage tail sheath protein FI